MAYGMPTLVVGNLTADPVLAYSQNGKPYARLTIANTPRVKDGNEWGDGPASFIGVTLFDALAENVAGSLTKGNRVIAYGELEKRVWQDKDGNDRESLQLENVNVFGADLRFARAQIQRAGGNQGGQQRPQQQAPQGGQQYGPPQGQQQYGPPQGAPQGPPQQPQQVQQQAYPPPQGAPQQAAQPPAQQAPQPPQQWGQQQWGDGAAFTDETPF